MSSNFVIEASGLAKAYAVGDTKIHQLLSHFGLKSKKPQFWALQPLNLGIRKGDVFGIIGENGSGKSTLLQLLCGTLQPTQGEIRVHGRIAALLELGAGFNPEFTGRENVYLNGAIFGLSQKEIDAKYTDIAKFASIGEFIDKQVKTYSSGMFVRLAFSVLAHVDADILVIDEALAVGDVFFTQKCMRFLQEFAQKGTILFVSHDSASVVNLCNRAMMLEHGVLVAEGNPRDVTEFYMQRQYDKKSTTVHNTEIIPEQTYCHSNLVSADGFEKPSEFGKGGLQIIAFACWDEKGIPLHQVHGKCFLSLEVNVLALSVIHSPLVGFALKDRHGKVLFGGNTEQAGLVLAPLTANSKVTIKFRVELPDLALGEYMFVLAAGDGSAIEHVMHHWIHDAWPIKSTLVVNSGLINVPLTASYSVNRQH